MANNYARDGHLHSLWQDTAEHPNAPAVHWPDRVVDVVVVGGGITGLTTALELVRKGASCVLVEARTIGFGTTGGTTAHLNTVLDLTYDRITAHFGADASRLLARGLVRTMDLIRSNAGALAPDAGFAVRASFTYSTSAEGTKQLEQMVKAAQDAGVPMEWVEEGPIPEAFQRVARVPDQAQLHPLRYLSGLARAFTEAGGMLVEHCRVAGLDEGEVLHVRTVRGTLRARHLVYATHIPPGVNVLHFRCAPWRSYALSAQLDAGRYPEALVYDVRDPYYYYRTQEIDGVPHLIAGGADHHTGKEEDTRTCFQRLEAHVRARYSVKGITHRWSSQYFEPADGLPYIGRLPGAGANVHVATGFGGNGMMLGSLSGIVLSEQILQGDSAYTELFDPTRVSPIAGFAQVAAEAVDVVGHLVRTPFLPEHMRTGEELRPGEGRLVRSDGKAMGLFRDDRGQMHAVSPACSHVKCTVAWNAAERSWDCPCHGSRFNVDGELLTGPARKDLDRPDLKPE